MEKKMQPLLLNLTKKTLQDVDFLPKKRVMIRPFDRVISRTRHKADFFHFSLQSESIEELKKLPAHGKSFEECCMQRALELEKMPYDKFYISYSGGIDSSTAIVSILRTWRPESLKKIVILMTRESFFENPSFFPVFVPQIPFG